MTDASSVEQGGGLAAAHLHVARTVCRRAERSVVPLTREHEVPEVAGQYLNRLSDFLFVAARFASKVSSSQRRTADRANLPAPLRLRSRGAPTRFGRSPGPRGTRRPLADARRVCQQGDQQPSACLWWEQAQAPSRSHCQNDVSALSWTAAWATTAAAPTRTRCNR